MDRLLSSRNFTNKMWNAGKFILFNLEQLDKEEWSGLAQADFSSPGALAQLPLAEQWVISALHQVCLALSADLQSPLQTHPVPSARLQIPATLIQPPSASN